MREKIYQWDQGRISEEEMMPLPGDDPDMPGEADNHLISIVMVIGMSMIGVSAFITGVLWCALEIMKR